MTTLTEFLLARIAEDEASLPDGFDCWYDPDRYRREVEAKRAIVEACIVAKEVASNGQTRTTINPDALLMVLASVYGDHPDYISVAGWRP